MNGASSPNAEELGDGGEESRRCNDSRWKGGAVSSSRTHRSGRSNVWGGRAYCRPHRHDLLGGPVLHDGCDGVAPGVRSVESWADPDQVVHGADDKRNTEQPPGDG